MAGSIKLFQFIRKFHEIVGIDLPQSNQKQCSINWKTTILFVSSAQMVFTTAGFLLFDAKSMFEYGWTVFVSICLINDTVSFSLIIRQSEKTFKFIANCEAFIEKREHFQTAYKEAMGKIELFNKFFHGGMFISIGFSIFIALPITFIQYFVYDMGEKSFYLFVPVWFPVHWKTPVGYLVALFAQSLGVTFIVAIFTQVVNLVYESCWLFVTIARDITKELVEFNADVRLLNGNREEVTKRFGELVKAFSVAKKCVGEFNETYKYSLLTFFSRLLFNLASISVSLQYQLWADSSNSLETISLIIVVNAVIACALLICEPGARMTKEFEIFEEELGQCNWYALPIEMQRMYMVFLANTQNPIEINSYGGIVCNRETLKKIFNKSLSYFMALRQFN